MLLARFRIQDFATPSSARSTLASPSPPDDAVRLSGFVRVSGKTTLKRSNSPVSIAILIAAGPKRTVH
jgi:hypothetical protein